MLISPPVYWCDVPVEKFCDLGQRRSGWWSVGRGVAAGAEPGDGLGWNRQRSGRDGGGGQRWGPDRGQNGRAAGGAAGGQVGEGTSSWGRQMGWTGSYLVG